MSTKPRAFKKPLFIAAASLLTAVIGGCALMFAAPAIIINPLAKNTALAQGIVLQKLVIDGPVRVKNLNGRKAFTLSIERASGAYEGDSFEIIDTEIVFGLHDLIAGRLDSIVIAEAKVRALTEVSETESLLQPAVSAQLAPLFSVQQQLRSLPVNSLSIKSLLLTLGTNDSFSSQMSAELTVLNLPDANIEINLAAEIADNRLNSEAGPLSLTAALALPEKDRMTLSAKLVLGINEAVVDGTAETDAFSLTIEADTGFASLVDLSALMQPFVGTEPELSVRVPDERITVTIEAESEQLAARITPAALEVSTALLQDAVSRISVSNAFITCTRLERCAGELTFSLVAEPSGDSWFSIPMGSGSETLTPTDATEERSREDLLLLKRLSFELPLGFTFQAGESDFFSPPSSASPLSPLSPLPLPSPVPTIRFGPWQAGTASGVLEFELRDFTAHFGRVSSVRGDVASTLASINLSGLALKDLRLTASIEADSLDANVVAELEMAGAPLVGASIAHSFARNTGSLDLRIEPAEFSQESPLSSRLDLAYLELPGGPIDILAGAFEMRADLGWSRQQDGDWILGGPLVAKANSLSGFAAETLFVAASTEIFAEVSYSQEQLLTLFNARPATLSISRLDTGFVLENILLDYQLALAPNTYELTISGARADFLGGEVAIPALRLSDLSRTMNQEQAVDIILTGVDLASIVNLADYPQVIVEGAISGYIPLNYTRGERGMTVTVSEGLISALKPGGSIRYTPLGGITNSNQSLQLVNEALANYQFSTLDTTLELDKTGELDLGVVLSGINPDMNAGQAINLNVNISDNLHTLLKSLQASRTLTDELERRLEK
jgi:hypothetical protein